MKKRNEEKNRRNIHKKGKRSKFLRISVNKWKKKYEGTNGK